MKSNEIPNPKEDKQFSSGVLMTVWQQVQLKPEIQVLARQQEEIIALQSKVDNQEKKLKKMESEVAKVKGSYNYLLETIKRLVGE